MSGGIRPLNSIEAARVAAERMRAGESLQSVPPGKNPAEPLSPQAALRGEVVRMVGAGVSALRIQDTLIEQGYEREQVFAIVDEVLANPPPPNPAEVGLPGTRSDPLAGMVRGHAVFLKVLGALIFVIGGFLWLGNVIGFFPTLPALGYFTLLLGGGIYGAGEKLD
jgi:hypothetical protein